MKRSALVLASLIVALTLAGPAASAVKAKVAGGKLTITGDSKANKLTLKLKKGAAGKLEVDVGSNGSVEFTFNRSAFAEIVLNAGGGNDTVTISEKNGVFTTLEATTMNGGKGNDKMTGGTGGETFAGGPGADTANGKGGADTFVWTDGSGKDRLDGAAGADLANFTGSVGADEFTLFLNGSRATVSTDGAVSSLGTIETVHYAALGGADIAAASNVSAAGVTSFQVDLAVAAAGDLAADAVEVYGDGNPNSLAAAAAVGGGLDVTGLGTMTVHISGSEAANDRLRVFGLGGNDTLGGGALSSLMQLTLDGGEGPDTINGGNGADTLLGGTDGDTIDGNQGNDTAFLGDGNDIFVWDPGDGSDIVEGQAGSDLLRFNGSAGSEIFAASANGGRLLFTRNVGNIVMDADDVESLDLNTLGSADTATINNLDATDVLSVDVDLGVSGVGDGAVDSVTVNGTVGADLMNVSGSSSFVGIVMTGFTVSLIDSEPANDTLTLNTSGGVDVVNASALAATSTLLTINGGTEGDVLIGSAGNDTVNGDAGNDVIQTLGGNDAINCGADIDYGDGGVGTDTGANCETQVGVP